MPIVPDSTFVERMGVHFAGYMFSMAHVVFRETPITDVGCDAQIELVNCNGIATGQMAALQIKSGDSRVNLKTNSFSLSEDPEHFEYWAKHTLPTFGVIYSPSLNTAVWLDLKEHSKRIVETNGPYRISVTLNENNELNKWNISGLFSDAIQSFFEKPVSLQEVQQIVATQLIREENVEPVEMSKEEAWKYLTNVLLTSESEPDVLADIGYRLSWYFPTVSEEQKAFFIERISNATNKELTNVILAIQDALETDRDDAAQLILDLLSYLPNPVEKLKDLALQQVVPKEALEALIQSVECTSQVFDDGFRDEIIRIYGVSDAKAH